MAYMSQEMKKALAPQIKAVLKKYAVKGSISVDNHSSIVVTLREGNLDFIGQANIDNAEYAARRGQRLYKVEGNYQVNTYHPEGGDATINKFFRELIDAMNGKGSSISNHDNSDLMTDYFDVGWYLNINVGRWNKPYVCTGPTKDGIVNGQPIEAYAFA